MMATEDVIELGSSDEEAEPAPKKVVPRKNKPNAMVHIPQGVTVMGGPKPNNTNINPIKKLLGKGVTVTKVNKPIGGNKQISIKQAGNKQGGVQRCNPPITVRNGKTVLPKNSRLPVGLPVIQSVRHFGPNIKFTPEVRSTFINPLSVSKINYNFQNRPNFTPVPVNSIRPKLPSNITLKKTTPNKKNVGNKSSTAKRPASTNTANVNKKRKVANVECGDVMTVDLEDDETPATSTGPQWYLRPEEAQCNDATNETNNEPSSATEETSSKPETTIEEKNNSEPTKFIEITIEDSPIKPIANKRTHEIGAELAITIDDSPVKPPTAKPASSPNSDNESQNTDKPPKHSKKKLNYPKETIGNTIEIEIEPINSEELEENTEEVENNDNISKKNKQIEIIIPDNVIEIMESPAKAISTPPTTPVKDKVVTHTRLKPIQMSEDKETGEIHAVPATSKKDKGITQTKTNPIEISDDKETGELHPPTIILSEDKETGEFHPVYQEFIDLCLKLENSNDMQTIVEKKIRNYYKQVPKDYTESEEFLELVQSKIMAMKAGPEKLYLYIKDVVDELNLQRKMAKAKPTVQDTRNLEAEKFQYGEESEFDPKRQRQIRKLEKTLKKLHRAIQKLEEQEVDFDDEDDSVYLLTERYKERMVRVHAKFCQLTNTKMPSEPRIHIEARPGQPSGPAKRLEKWVNKKVPIGTPLPFPDFHDVLRCVREANEEDKLGLNEADIMDEARDLFIRCGKKLQRRRQENEWRLAASRISHDVDPAEANEDLKKKLETNKQLASKKETDVFNKYADKQSQLKLEAVEIGDKEAEESPAEEEDDDDVEEVQIIEDTLDDKERRKETIRKLLKSKNKKIRKSGGEKITSKDDEGNTKTVSNDVSENKDNEASKRKKESLNNDMDVDAVPAKINKDSMEVDENDLNKSKDSKDQSSDENKVDSDMDELHLLQKLHSDEMNSSTADTTDSESPIDISDTLSSGDSKKPTGDVISIENSSYSESENKNEDPLKDKMDVDSEVIAEAQKENVSKTVKIDNRDRLSGELECASSGVQINKTNNDEYNESVESILLGSSDEEDDESHKNESPKSSDNCVNLKDDAISIGETAVQAATEAKKKDDVVESSASETKIIEDSPESVIECDEAKSVEALTEEDNNSPSEGPKEPITIASSDDNAQEFGKSENQDIEMSGDDSSPPPATSNLKIISIEEVTSEDSQSLEHPENNQEIIPTASSSPKHITDIHESKSVKNLPEEDSNSANEGSKKQITTGSSNDNTQEFRKPESQDVKVSGEDGSSLPETSNLKTNTVPVISVDLKSPEQTENNQQDIHRPNALSSDKLIPDTAEPQADEKVSDIETVRSSSNREEKNTDVEANIKNSQQPHDSVNAKESSKSTETITEPAESKDTLNKPDGAVDSGENTESLDSVLKDLQSDLEMHENLDSTSVNDI